MVLSTEGKTKLPLAFTYSVVWEEHSDLAWASRWDTYLHMSDVQIHWFAICNSVAIVLFLSGEVGGREGGREGELYVEVHYYVVERKRREHSSPDVVIFDEMSCLRSAGI